MRRSLALANLLMALLVLPVHAAAVTPVPLPEGRWFGAMKVRTTPDVDREGEWTYELAISNCGGDVRIQSKTPDGDYTEGFRVEVFSLRKLYLLVMFSRETLSGETGWLESQAWTLVDARPKGWTISISRAVLNQDVPLEEPWRTFRQMGLGTLEHDPEGCRARPTS